MARPEASVLRGAMAGMYERTGAIGRANAEKDGLIGRLLSRAAELESEVRRLSGRNRLYEGPNAPPSTGPIGRGRRMLGTLLTCTDTWKARGLDGGCTLRRVLAGEAVPGA